jgi:hypothetical protein
MPSTESPVSLSECHRRLCEELGDDAPAEITLKRWKKDGKLDKAVVRGTGHGRSARFHYNEVLRITRGQSLATRPHTIPARPRATPASAELSPEAIAQIAKLVAEQLLAALPGSAAPATSAARAADTQVPAELLDAIRTLEHTRKTLMVRYDSEITGLKARVDQLAEQVKGAQAPTLELSRINQRLGAIAGMLEQGAAAREEAAAVVRAAAA